jgi:hypothetical protein
MTLYNSLNAEKNEIRLLDIRPGKFDAPIQCDIRHTSLTSNLNFTALSYTWGDPNVRKPIQINRQSLDVTLNLYNALHHMRSLHEVRTFWIDAICINQDDLEERAAQVLRMCDIYTIAKGVEVWLGQEEDEFDAEAMQLVTDLGAAVADAEGFLAKGRNNQQREQFFHSFAESTPEKLRALSRLFKRPWWTRIWIVQELSLAKQGNAIVRCGTLVTAWTNFLITAYAIDEFWHMVSGMIWEEYPDEKVESHQHGIRLAQCRKVDATIPDFTLLELLNQHRDCAATDPRDKVYGLLGLSGDAAKIGLKPSYTSTARVVFVDLFQKYVKATGTLDMLCEVRFPKTLVDLPSWVPDWSTDQTVPGICIHNRYMGGNHFSNSPINQYEEYRASGDAQAEVQFTNNAITITAFHVGAIAYLGQVDPGMTLEDLDVIDTLGTPDAAGYSGSACATFNDWCNMMLKCPDWDKIEARYRFGAENALEVFCRTLIGDRNGRMTIPGANNNSDADHGYDEDNSDADHGCDEEMTDVKEYPDEDEDNQEHTGNSDGEDNYTNPLDVKDQRAFSPENMLNMAIEDYRSCLGISYGKRFAILDSGHIGIVPGHSEVSDVVVVISGCSLPLVVRKGSSGTILVGESYVHGVTNGEALNSTPEILKLL